MKGLFIGLATLDFIYLVEQFPTQNQKIVALDQCITAGGPAANAAVTFQHFDHCATWMGVLGNHPLSQLIKADLQEYSVNLIDLEPNYPYYPPVSSITVTQSSGDRSVVSLNATKIQATIEQLPPSLLEDIDIILIDGHQMPISFQLAQMAKQKNITVVVDGGSWKSGFEEVLSFADYLICSANFYPPNCHHLDDILKFLDSFSLKGFAMTQGEKPIIYRYQDQFGEFKVNYSKIVDTLGAGDIFHGAFCHYILQHDFILSLQQASKIASHSCEFFGTREGLKLFSQ